MKKKEYPPEVIEKSYKILELFNIAELSLLMEEQDKLIEKREKKYWNYFELFPEPVIHEGRQVGTTSRPMTNDERNILGGYIKGMKHMSLRKLYEAAKEVIKNHKMQEN